MSHLCLEKFDAAFARPERMSIGDEPHALALRAIVVESGSRPNYGKGSESTYTAGRAKLKDGRRRAALTFIEEDGAGRYVTLSDELNG
jgi:hypothetical protein